MISGPKMVVYAEVCAAITKGVTRTNTPPCASSFLPGTGPQCPQFLSKQLDQMLPYDGVSLHGQLRRKNLLSGVESVKLSDLNAADPHNMHLAVRGPCCLLDARCSSPRLVLSLLFPHTPTLTTARRRPLPNTTAS